MEENREKAVEQLSGRVTQSQKEYFSDMDGSFSEKVAELIELHKHKRVNDVFTISPNIDAIQKAITTILRNVECIETNANVYVDDFNNTLASRLSMLETDSIELRDTRNENETLKESNNGLLVEYSKLDQLYQEQRVTLENKENYINTVVENNNKLLQEKLEHINTIDELKSSYSEKLEELENTLAKSKDKITELNNSIELKNEKLHYKENQIEDLKQDLGETKLNAKQDIKELNARLETLLKQINDNRVDSQKLEKNLNTKIDKLIKELQDSKEELHKENLAKQKLQLELDNLKSKED